MTDFENKGVEVGGLSDRLGKAIVDRTGRPSGSPANWEALNGVSADGPPPTEEEMKELIGRISNELLKL